MHCTTDRMLPNTDFTGTQEQLVTLCSRERRGMESIGAPGTKAKYA